MASKTTETNTNNKKVSENEKEITAMFEIYSSDTEVESETEIEKMKNSNNTIININDASNDLLYRKPRKERRHIRFMKEFLKKRVYITAFVSILLLFAIDIVSYIIFNLIMGTERETLKSDMKKTNRTKESTVFLIVYVCIIRPILEEIVFRKFVFNVVKKLSKLLAYLISSFLFAFAYFDCSFSGMWHNMDDFIAFFLKGIVLAATYDYDGYLLASLYSNIFYNCLLVFIQFIVL
ncbi:hypothetical protein H8356DRAFT_1637376 [Neocallimastix lanati (nom. inval.)]|jgi:membrane protease YdiL (CAAX protease family)|nr:hypothetical protein H8356DRAFT_1637376 [Neocallimastix sp. JGI-2020a]